MAIAFVQSKSNGAANAGPFDVVLDSAAGAGNLILAFHVDGDTADNTMPAITSPGMTDVGTSEQYANGSGGDCNSKAWYYYAAGGETTITFPDTGGGTNDGVSGVVMEFSGVASAAQGGPFSTAITKNTGTGSGNADNPQITTAAGDCVVIMAGAATASTNIGTFTAPANYTTNANLGTAGSDTIEARAAMAYRLSGYSNPEDPAAWALSGSAAGDSWNAVTLALKAAPSSTTMNGTTYTLAPTFPTGVLQYQSQGTTFTKAPTFFTGEVQNLLQTIAGVLFQSAPTFPTGVLNVQQNIVGASTFTRAPTFPAGGFNLQAQGATFTEAPTFFTGTVDAGGVEDDPTAALYRRRRSPKAHRVKRTKGV